LANAPRITVIVASRERPNDLRACLDSLFELDYPAFEIVVVDNDPVSDDAARLIKEHFADRMRYLREDRRGLAWAHNRGLMRQRLRSSPLPTTIASSTGIGSPVS
jgi:glycosyltransferase involved in cell wall biosynthesis